MRKELKQGRGVVIQWCREISLQQFRKFVKKHLDGDKMLELAGLGSPYLQEHLDIVTNLLMQPTSGPQNVLIAEKSPPPLTRSSTM